MAKKSFAGFLLLLNFCMYVIVTAIGGWAINVAIDRGFVIGEGFSLPAHFSPLYFPIGNDVTGFFVIFSLIAGVIGIASVMSGVLHIRSWSSESLPSATSSAIIAWTLTLLSMGLACEEIRRQLSNANLRTMEAFMIILSFTQLLYILVINMASPTTV